MTPKAAAQARCTGNSGVYGMERPSGQSAHAQSMGTAASVHFARTHDDAISICIQPITGPNRYTLYLHHHIALTFIALLGRQGHQGKRPDANGRGIEFCHIPHATIHHDACPAVACSRGSEIAAHESPAKRASAINHQNMPFARRVHGGLDEGVVLMAFHRTDRAGKGKRRTKMHENRRQNTEKTRVISLVCITEITGAEGKES